MGPTNNKNNMANKSFTGKLIRNIHYAYIKISRTVIRPGVI